MILPHSPIESLWIAILGMVCLAFWAHIYKFTGRWRFELFYLDFAFGFAAAGLIYAFTVGSLGFDSFSFLDDLRHANSRSFLFALAAGASMNLGTMLLVAAVSVSGIAFAFTTSTGLAVVMGAAIALATRHSGKVSWLLGGMLLGIVAAAIAGFAYSKLVRQLRKSIPRDAKGRPAYRISAFKAIMLCAGAAPLLAVSYPLLDRARYPEVGLGPYSLIGLLSAAVLGSTVVYSLVFMNLPVQGEPVDIFDYVKSKPRNHLIGFLAGAIWCSGLLGLLVASESNNGEFPIGRFAFTFLLWCGPLLAALLAVVFRNEYGGGAASLRLQTALSVLLLVAGIVLFAMGVGRLAGKPGVQAGSASIPILTNQGVAEPIAWLTASMFFTPSRSSQSSSAPTP